MFRTILGTLACLGFFIAPASAQIPVYNSGGFEGPRFVPGPLTGQDPVLGPWQQSVSGGGPLTTATVQGATVQAGSQAVRIDRAPNSEGFWFVSKPTVGPQQINVSWDMRVAQSVGAQQFGPFFGVDSYSGGGGVNRLGMLGVDATTGEVLYIAPLSDPNPGLQVVAGGPGGVGSTVPFNTFNNFRLQLDYNGTGSGTYSAFVNGTLVQTAPFFTPGNVNFNFSDAPIAGIAAAGGAANQAATGTAFFDNYVITAAAPEPSSIALAGLGVVGLIVRRRRAASRG